MLFTQFKFYKKIFLSNIKYDNNDCSSLLCSMARSVYLIDNYFIFTLQISSKESYVRLLDKSSVLVGTFIFDNLALCLPLFRELGGCFWFCHNGVSYLSCSINYDVLWKAKTKTSLTWIFWTIHYLDNYMFSFISN